MDLASLIEITPLNAPYWEGLRRGVLQFQQCGCGHRWLPPRTMCPRCLGDSWQWQAASGKATIVSWVVYHIAYHPDFKDQLPYNVALIKLDEGPQLIAHLSASARPYEVGAPVELDLDMSQVQPLARFKM